MRSLHHKFVWKGIDMKTIAVIESCDTKAEEAGYIKELIEQEGLSAVVIDVSTIFSMSALVRICIRCRYCVSVY